MTIPSETIIGLLIRLWRHLSKRRRYQFILLGWLMLLSTFAEIVSLGAVLPFFGVLLAPDKIFRNRSVKMVAGLLGITSESQLVLSITILFGITAMTVGVIRLLQLWVSTRLSFACGTDLSCEVYRRTLYQPYHVHISRNSSYVISSITIKVDGVVFGVLLPVLAIISAVVLVIAISITLMVFDPLIASITMAGFGVCYGVVSWSSRKKLRTNSLLIAREETFVVKALQEGLGGIRDVLIDGSQPLYCSVYGRADRQLRRAQGSNVFISGSPRFIIESFGMILLAFLAYALSMQPGGISKSLPVLGALALGAQRLLPALQNIFSSWASISGTYSSLHEVVLMLDQSIPDEFIESSDKPLAFVKSIKFHDVRFRYSLEDDWVLDGVDLTIPKGACVGFVGSTGSGKSTALDLLMGLLLPSDGRISVDDRFITKENIRSWQRTIAHVPQNIFLSDASIAENIAFGVAYNSIDFDRVRQVAREAQISSYIEDLPDGYNSFVGERGVRISGGQRQRIGIARALYKQASVLVFDEATSALDNITEQSVMDAIEGLSEDLTTIIIAHRLTTVRRCKIIFELRDGKVVGHGTYDELIESSSTFRQMVLVSR